MNTADYEADDWLDLMWSPWRSLNPAAGDLTAITTDLLSMAPPPQPDRGSSPSLLSTMPPSYLDTLLIIGMASIVSTDFG